MFSHVMLGTNDKDQAKRFYDALFAAAGGKPGTVNAKGHLVYAHGGGRLIVGSTVNGEPATGGNGQTLGFAMESEDQAKAWHDAGVANGGRSVEDPPGIRQSPMGAMYLAYLRDPDGNKLCGVYRVPA